MPAFIDLTNQQFGRLTVLHRHPENTNQGSARWICECGCENKTIVIVSAAHLRNGTIEGCGCVRRERVIAAKTTHGLRHTPENSAWRGIKDRCYNPKHRHYADYGGRGITMCDEWKDDFEAFYRDMGPRPSPEHSIDRVENDKSYSKDNCRWATAEEQANNRRSNLVYELNGVFKTLPDWCSDLGLNYKQTYQRIYRGMLFEEAIKINNLIKSFPYTINRETRTIGEWCLQYGVRFYQTCRRLYSGWTFEEAIQPIERKEFILDGEKCTLESCCDLLGLDSEETYLRVLRGTSFEDIIRE